MAMRSGFYDLECTTVYAARFDARFCYCLYVPPDIRLASRRPELLVAVHGSPRAFIELRDRFRDFGEANGVVVLAPLFPVGIAGDDNADGYKYLEEPGLRYDTVLLDLVAEVGARFGLAFERFGLFGFSGGGQFANRFLLVRPECLWAVAIGAPGSVTLVDSGRDWWVGTAGMAERFGHRPDLEALRRVPVQILVGTADLEVTEITHRPGGRHWIDGANHAGATRPERSEALRLSLAAAGLAVTHEAIPGIGHEIGPVIGRAKPFLAAQLARFRQDTGAAR